MKRWIATLLAMALLCFSAASVNGEEPDLGGAIAIELPEGGDTAGEAELSLPEDDDLIVDIGDAGMDVPVDIDDLAPLPELDEAVFDGNGVPANASEDFEIDENGVLTKYKGPGGDVVIPDEVTEIGDFSFSDNSSLISVSIPNGVRRIGNYAFRSCYKMTTVSFPDSLVEIGQAAFWSCSGIKSISIPNSVTDIGKNGFSYCKSLTELTIPKSIKRIEEYTFAHCTNLKYVTIPNSVTAIEDSAFYGCENVESLTIPNSVESIGNAAFEYWKGLKELIIPGSVVSVGNYAFRNCYNIRNLTIENGVMSIGSTAFALCQNLITAIVPKSVTTIGKQAFYGCPNLTIYGEAGSYAETYANKNNIPFVAGSPEQPSTFSIKIGNVNESEGKYAQFDEPLEQYILNMDSDKCYPDLAYMLMALSAAAYNKAGAGSGKLTVDKDGYVDGDAPGSKALYHIAKAYSDLGFADYAAYNYYSDPNASGYGSDSAAFTVGVKPLSENEALALIVVRGSFGWENDFSSKDWKSNLRIDMDAAGRHYGFGAAADKVYSKAMSFLKKRYKTGFIKSNIRFVITGHSRGAAVANLLAVKLHDAGVPNSNVYDYNFACPDTVRGLTGANLAKGHENIWNINNTADAVGVIPGVVGDGLDGIVAKFQSLFVSWGKYGTTRFYCNDWNKASEFDLMRTFAEDSSHDFAKYVRDLGKKPSKYYTWAKVVARRAKLGVDDAIHSIVQAFYPKYARTSLAMAKMTVKDQVYTGKAIKPDVRVQYLKMKLVKNKDYTLSYRNNRAIGTATVTVKGKDNYTGSTTLKFRINPRAVTGFKLKAGAQKAKASWKKVKGVTGYLLEYSQNKDSISAKKLKVSKASAEDCVLPALKSGKAYYVRIRAYKEVDGKNYWSAWSKIKSVKIK